jgi:signal transduction histidine kinase
VRITRKLAVLVTVPLVAVVAFAGLALVTTAGQAVRADGLRALVAVAAAGGDLAHQLQAERAAAVAALAAGAGPSQNNAYLQEIAATDQSAGRYRQVRSRLSSVPAGAAGLLDRIDDQLGLLGPLRRQVQAGAPASSAVAFAYRIVIASIIASRESVAQAGGAPADIADQIRAAVDLSHAAEAVGLQQVAVLRAVGPGRLTLAAQQEITSARTAYIEAVVAFGGLASVEWRAWWEQAQTGDEVLAAQQLEDAVARTPPGGVLDVDRGRWLAAVAAKVDRIRQVEARVDGQILAAVTRLRDSAWRWAGVEAGAVMLTVLVALLLAVGLGRPIIRGLRRLRDAAHTVAYTSLPAAVAALQQPQYLGSLSPTEFAGRASPVHLPGRDEIAEVARAFDSVHREAVRTAAEQALLRVNVGAMFVALARRLQRRVSQLTAKLDEAERGEQDAERLGQLFDLDLLVALLGRTNDSLLVLGGQGPARVRDGGESLLDVLRGAQSQVEAYARIECRVVDDGVAIAGRAVDDVVHVLAELFDNAARFSKSETPVMVDARLLGDRVVIQVTDQGIGIEVDQRAVLNQRLSAPPQVDVAAVQAMGLTVVGHIAARYGIRVELRAGRPRGTVAEVTLPLNVFEVVSPPPSMPVVRDEPTAAPQPRLLDRPPGEWPPAPRTPLDAPAAQISQDRPPGEDDTHELPIFEELRASRWFTAGLVAGAGDGAWHSAADQGWQAADRAAAPAVSGTTDRGLPKRVPQAQLVPGGIDTAPARPEPRRDPARVSAVMAAYARGVSTSRARHMVAVSSAGYDMERS